MQASDLCQYINKLIKWWATVFLLQEKNNSLSAEQEPRSAHGRNYGNEDRNAPITADLSDLNNAVQSVDLTRNLISDV